MNIAAEMFFKRSCFAINVKNLFEMWLVCFTNKSVAKNNTLKKGHVYFQNTKLMLEAKIEPMKAKLSFENVSAVNS